MGGEIWGLLNQGLILALVSSSGWRHLTLPTLETAGKATSQGPHCGDSLPETHVTALGLGTRFEWGVCSLLAPSVFPNVIGQRQDVNSVIQSCVTPKLILQEEKKHNTCTASIQLAAWESPGCSGVGPSPCLPGQRRAGGRMGAC